MGVSRKQSTQNFPKNEPFLPSDTHTRVSVSRGKKYSFFGKTGMLCFLETPVLRFALLPYYRHFVAQSWTLMLQKVFSLLKFSPALFEKIQAFVWLVFQKENKWIFLKKTFVFLKTCWFPPGCDVSYTWLLLIR